MVLEILNISVYDGDRMLPIGGYGPDAITSQPKVFF